MYFYVSCHKFASWRVHFNQVKLFHLAGNPQCGVERMKGSLWEVGKWLSELWKYGMLSYDVDDKK